MITKFGCRITALVGGGLCVVSLVTSSFVEQLDVLFFTYSLLFGLGSSCIFSAGLVVISQYFNQRQSLATGLLTAGHGGGVLLIGPTLQSIIDTMGWRNTYRIMAGVAFVLCLPAVAFDPNVESKDDENKRKVHEEEERVERGNEVQQKENETEMKLSKHMIDFSVWREPPVIAIILGACVVEFGHFVPQIHLVSFYVFYLTQCSETNCALHCAF